MTTLTMRMIKGDFVVTGPDVEPMKFKSRREARELVHGSPSGIANNGGWPRGKRHQRGGPESTPVDSGPLLTAGSSESLLALLAGRSFRVGERPRGHSANG